jgi:hypothetical protein
MPLCYGWCAWLWLAIVLGTPVCVAAAGRSFIALILASAAQADRHLDMNKHVTVPT